MDLTNPFLNATGHSVSSVQTPKRDSPVAEPSKSKKMNMSKTIDSPRKLCLLLFPWPFEASWLS